MKISISSCYTHAEGFEDIKQSLEELVGEEPDWKEAYGLAGPNDIAQLCMDSEGWAEYLTCVVQAAGAVGVTTFAAVFSKRMAELASDEVREALQKLKQSPLSKAWRGIKRLNEQEYAFSLTVPLEGNRRNVGVLLDDVRPEYITWAMYNFAKRAPMLELVARCGGDPEAKKYVQFGSSVDAATQMEANTDNFAAKTFAMEMYGTFTETGAIKFSLGLLGDRIGQRQTNHWKFRDLPGFDLIVP